jgi:drug/metabolite transporter (DMT)-like permease
MQVDWRTVSLVPLYVSVSVAGDILLSAGMRQMPPFAGLHGPELLRFFRYIVTSPVVLAGVGLQAVNFALLLALFSWEDLSVVVPARAGSYLVVGLVARWWFHELVSPLRWAGIVLVTAGVALILSSTSRRADPATDETGKPQRPEAGHPARAAGRLPG